MNKLKMFAAAAMIFPLAVFSAVEAPSFISSENTILWLDASAFNTMDIDSSGQVTSWRSRVGSCSAGKQTAAGFTYPTFSASGYGVPVVDFGEFGVKKDLLLSSRLTTIRTVIYVGKIVSDGGAFWLGDSSNLYDFHRGSNGAYANRTYGTKFDKIWNGSEQVANIYEEIPDSDKINIITMQMKQNCVAHSLTKDRNLDTDTDKSNDGRYGGRQIAELICFNRVLTDEERSAIVSYLEKKWIEKDVLNVTVSASSDDLGVEFSNDGGENWANTAEISSVMGNDVVVEVRSQNGENSFFLWEGLPSDAVFMNDMHSKVSFKVDWNRVLKVSAVASGQENVWLGGDGEFEDSNKWSLGRVPCLVDNVIIDNSVENVTNIITVLQPFSIGSLTIGGSGGGVRLVLKNGLSTNFVAGAVVVEDKGRITHHGPTSDNSYRLNLKAGGNMEVKAGGSVGSHGMGFARGKGITSAGAYGSGVSKGCHGGRGSGAAYSYGNIRLPSYPGMGGVNRSNCVSTWGCGGGVVNIEVLGDLTVDGEIESDAGGEYDQSQAGGSLLLKCKALSGTGRISACPTRNTAGGGRIAIYQSGAGELSFSGVIGSSGGSEFARSYKYYYEKPWTTLPSTLFYAGAYGAGTIYVENKNDLPGRGKLIIKGSNSNNALLSGYTDISALVEDSQEPFGEVIITNGARVMIRSGCTLKVSRKLDVRGGELVQENATAGLEIVGDGDFEFFGKSSLYNVKCVEPGKKLYFGAPSELSQLSILEGGLLTFDGGSKETPISLLPTDSESEWTINIDVNASQDISSVAILNCNASAGAGIMAFDSKDLGGNTKCSFSSKVIAGEKITWTGEVSSDWHDGSNWSLGRTVFDTDDVVIAAGAANWPVVTGGYFTLNKLTVDKGALLTIGADNNIAVTNDFVCSGAVEFVGESRLTFSGNVDFSASESVKSDLERICIEGDGVKEVNFAGHKFNDIFVKRTGGTLVLNGGVTARKFGCDARAAEQAITVESGSVISAENVYVNALVDTTAYLTMDSSVATSKWYLNVENRAVSFAGVKIRDCDASGGKLIVAGSSSVNVGGGNVNFDFTSPVAVWSSSADGSFDDAERWSPRGVPAKGANIVILASGDEKFTVTADAAFEAASFSVVSIEDAAVTFKAAAAYAIDGDVVVGKNATFVSNAYDNDAPSPNTVGGDFYLLSGSVLTHEGPSNTENAKVHISVGGDFIVESGASIDVKGKGYRANNGPGYAYDGMNQNFSGYASYGRPEVPYAKACYGSVFAPFDWGSGSVIHTGSFNTRGDAGGAVKISVKGAMHLDGTINADGTHEYDTAPTGGSIYLDVGVLSGSGSISAAAGTIGQPVDRRGSGGRIAIYQRGLPALTEFEGTISTSNGRNGGAGTYCFCGSEAASSGIDVYFAAEVRQPYISQFPMKADYYSENSGLSAERQLMKAFAKVNLIIDNATVVVTNAAAENLWNLGATIRVRDIDIDQGAKLYLNGNTIQVLDSKHKNGRNWGIGTYEEAIASGNIVLGEANGQPGKIIWAPKAFSITIR